MFEKRISVADNLSGKSVFLTGVTGFVGKAILEKLLRGCPNIDKIYVLIRKNPSHSMEDRFKTLLRSQVFQEIRRCEDDDNILSKVVPILGDVILPELGFSKDDSAMLKASVSVVFHAAANIKFSTGLKDVMAVNCGGTRNMIEWAKLLPNLKAFLYISTAFSNSDREIIEEKVYSLGLDPDIILNTCLNMPEHIVSAIGNALKGKHMNYYTYSKHVTEVLVEKYSSDIPICIVRPAITGPAYQEPFPGWNDNLVGICGFIAGMARGIVRCHYTNIHGQFDLVPVDQVVNLIIAAAVRLSVENKSKMMVYNYSSTEHPFLCSESQSALLEAYAKNPMDQLFWYPSVMFIRNTKVFAALDFFLHFLPALITDSVGFILGKERRMLSIYNNLQRAIAATKEIQRTYFSISTNNTKDLYNLLQEDDQILFNFNIRDVNIRKYFQDLHYGIKFYVLKEKHEDLKNARGNFERFRILYHIGWIIMLVALFCLIFPTCLYVRTYTKNLFGDVQNRFHF